MIILSLGLNIGFVGLLLFVNEGVFEIEFPNLFGRSIVHFLTTQERLNRHQPLKIPWGIRFFDRLNPFLKWRWKVNRYPMYRTRSLFIIHKNLNNRINDLPLLDFRKLCSGYIFLFRSIRLKNMIDDRFVANHEGFFQTAVFVPGSMYGNGFQVECGMAVASGDPGLGLLHMYQITAMNTLDQSANNYGSIYCLAGTPQKSFLPLISL